MKWSLINNKTIISQTRSQGNLLVEDAKSQREVFTLFEGSYTREAEWLDKSFFLKFSCAKSANSSE